MVLLNLKSLLNVVDFKKTDESEAESVVQSCPTLCDPMDCSRPGSSVHIILQVRILEQGATSFSREPPWPRDRTCVSCGSHIGRQVLYHREPPGDGVIPMRGLSICQGKGAKSNSRRLNYRSWDSFHVEAEAEDRGKDRFGLWFWQLVELLISNNCHFIWHRADAEFVFVNERKLHKPVSSLIWFPYFCPIFWLVS